MAILDLAGYRPSVRFAIDNYFEGGRHPIGVGGIGVTPNTTSLSPADFDDPALDDTLHYALVYSSLDSDGDGLANDLEELFCTDPDDFDTDDGGISDGAEDSNHNGFWDSGETDPCQSDTDGDGFRDGQEDVNHNGRIDIGEGDTNNHPPTADAGPDQNADEGDTVTLDGSNSSDPDDGISSYLWTQTAGTSVTLSDATAVKPTFTAPDVGTG